MNAFRIAVGFLGVVTVTGIWIFKETMPRGLALLAYVIAVLSVIALSLDVFERATTLAPYLPDAVQRAAQRAASIFAATTYTESQQRGLLYVSLALGASFVVGGLILLRGWATRPGETGAFEVLLCLVGLPSVMLTAVLFFVMTDVKYNGFVLFHEQVVRGVHMASVIPIGVVCLGGTLFVFDSEESTGTKVWMGMFSILMGVLAVGVVYTATTENFPSIIMGKR